MSLDFTGDKSTWVQVMAWCCLAASHYLSQCWPRSVSPYVVTRSQWVKLRTLSQLLSCNYKGDNHERSLNSFMSLALGRFGWYFINVSVGFPQLLKNHWNLNLFQDPGKKIIEFHKKILKFVTMKKKIMEESLNFGSVTRVGASTQILSTSTLLSMSTSTSTEKMCEYEYEYFSLSTSTSYPNY